MHTALGLQSEKGIQCAQLCHQYKKGGRVIFEDFIIDHSKLELDFQGTLKITKSSTDGVKVKQKNQPYSLNLLN